MTRKFMVIIALAGAALAIAGCSRPTAGAQNSPPEPLAGIRLEHVAINVQDPVNMAKWYSENLGMKVLRKGPPPVNMHFISDARGNMMLEIYNNPPDAVPDYPSMDPLSLHIAFMVDDVQAVRRKLIAAGATDHTGPFTTPAGDELTMLRDPWGVPIQFLKRAKPMLSHK